MTLKIEKKPVERTSTTFRTVFDSGGHHWLLKPGFLTENLLARFGFQTARGRQVNISVLVFLAFTGFSFTKQVEETLLME
jgi:hypothetical protein